ncbi:hypothetical protein CTI12_AA223190 [Artemisia annua]|uniref:Uncharacterized protein n=1 Tax=Artemisia annua TaxID=35608 RepID=A0A2U1NVI1_ARTAN|nr:hypothetical protein CTI12_AA223190 [Artemisia annua]
MAATPNLNEIKEACGSNDLVDCYKFLFGHNKADELGFLARMGLERDQLVATVDKREQNMNEADSFGATCRIPVNVASRSGHFKKPTKVGLKKPTRLSDWAALKFDPKKKEKVHEIGLNLMTQF